VECVEKRLRLQSESALKLHYLQKGEEGKVFLYKLLGEVSRSDIK
jgi:hypothetical protein